MSTVFVVDLPSALVPAAGCFRVYFSRTYAWACVFFHGVSQILS